MRLNTIGLCIALFFIGGCERIWQPEGADITSSIESYRLQLEQRLLLQYNQLPNYAGQVARVEIIAAQTKWTESKDQARVEFTQLVLNKWGERLTKLESEYYIVTFGHGAPTVVNILPKEHLKTIALDTDFGERETVQTGVIGRLQKNAPASPAPAEQPGSPSRTTTDSVPHIPPANIVKPLRAQLPVEPVQPTTQTESLRAMKAPALPTRVSPRTEVRNIPQPTMPAQPELD